MMIRTMRLKLYFCFCFYLVFSQYAFANVSNELAQYYQDLASADIELKRKAVLKVAHSEHNRFGSQGVHFLLEAVQDPDERIKVMAISGLRFMNIRSHERRDEIEQMLHAHFASPNVNVSMMSAKALGMLYGGISAFENSFLQRLMVTRDVEYQQEMMTVLNRREVASSHRIQNVLLSLVEEGKTGVAEVAAIILLGAGIRTEELLRLLVELAEKTNPPELLTIMDCIVEFGHEALPYLPRLKQLRDKVLLGEFEVADVVLKDNTVKSYANALSREIKRLQSLANKQ